MADPMAGAKRTADWLGGWMAAREEFAALAGMYATENFRLATDTVLTDPVLTGRDRSPAGFAQARALQIQGAAFSGAAHCAEDIASAIRAKEPAHD